MPGIDVSLEVLYDGFVAGTKFVVIRRRSWTDVNGIERHQHKRIDAVGSIFPTGDNSLLREPDEQAQNKEITVICNFLLRGASSLENSEWQPDIVFWKGEHFLAQSIEDYSQFGPGFTATRCVAFDYTTASAPRDNAADVGVADFRYPKNSGLLGALL
jgi:hypothetical protein